jgi:TolA-binding protein
MLRSLHSRAFALGTLVPFSLFAVAACGGSNDSAPNPAGDTVATTSPVVAQPGTTVATGVVVPTTVTYAQADSVFRTRDYASAATMFAAYTQRRPENPWGHYMLGLSDW